MLLPRGMVASDESSNPQWSLPDVAQRPTMGLKSRALLVRRDSVLGGREREQRLIVDTVESALRDGNHVVGGRSKLGGDFIGVVLVEEHFHPSTRCERSHRSRSRSSNSRSSAR